MAGPASNSLSGSAHSAEALLWQALSLTRGLIHEMDDLEVELGGGGARPMIGPLNDVDEHIFFALFAFVPGMYGEDEELAMACDQYFHERLGNLPSRLGLAGYPRRAHPPAAPRDPAQDRSGNDPARCYGGRRWRIRGAR